jgi:hypothetical protein
MKWKVIRRFRKSGASVYEVSNGEVTRLIFGYKELMVFMGEFK